MSTIAPRFQRKSQEERQAEYQEALARVRTSPSMANYVQVFVYFMAEPYNLPFEEIDPKQNVLTYKAWRALGRHVRKGEHGCRVTVWGTSAKRENDPSTGEEREQVKRFCTTAVVFHKCQTEPDGGKN